MVSSNMFLITFVTLITTALGTTTIIISASPSVSVTPSSSGNTSAQSSVGVVPSVFGNTSIQSASANSNQGNTIVPSASATANNNQAGNPGQSATTNNNPGNTIMPSASGNPGQSATSNNNPGNTNPGNTIMPSASGNPGQSATSNNNPGNTIMPSGSSGSLAVSSIYFNLSDPGFADKFLKKYKHLFSEFSCTNKASCCEGKGNSTIKVKVKDCNKNFPGHCNVNSTFEVKEKLCLDTTMIPCCSQAAFLNTSLVLIFLGLFLHLVGN